MRLENAICGGEMSAHHYFRYFSNYDIGLNPWLLVIELMSISGKPLLDFIGDRIAASPCSCEINLLLPDTKAAMAWVEEYFAISLPTIDCTDRISLVFDQWRSNQRPSNTVSLLRLNVESRGDAELVDSSVQEIEKNIGARS